MTVKACPECGNEVERGPQALYCSEVCADRVANRRRYERQRDALRKVDKLAIAGAVAPKLRSKKATRRINVVDKDGATIRQIDDVEFAQGILRRAGIEFSVEHGKAEHVICALCSKPFRPVRVSQPAKRCPECANGRCTDCGNPLRSSKTVARAKKAGTVPRCVACSVKARSAKAELRAKCVRCGEKVSLKVAQDQRREQRRGHDVGCRSCRRMNTDGLGANGVEASLRARGLVRRKDKPCIDCGTTDRPRSKSSCLCVECQKRRMCRRANTVWGTA